MSDKRRHVGIQEFVLCDIEEKHAPPSSPVLAVQLLPDGCVSLAIEKYEEDAKGRSYERVQSVIVDFEPLWNGLAAMIKSEGTKAA